MMSSQPSLLVFTLDPAAESARRQLLPRRLDHLGTQLLRQTLSELLAAGKATGCRLEVSSPHRLELPDGVRTVVQTGSSFGGRFRHAVSDALRRNDGPTIVVGSDIPGLGRQHLAEALRALERSPDAVVLGPSVDGGFYLLATNRPIDRELAQVRWRRRDTLVSLERALRESGREIVLLAPLRDLDCAQDLAHWVAGEATLSHRWNLFGRLLRRLVAAFRRPERRPRLGSPNLGLTLVHEVRGPPAV